MWRSTSSSAFQHASKSLKAQLDHITKEPLPERWVELIHYLNEKEKREAAGVREEGSDQLTLRSARLVFGFVKAVHISN